MSTNTDAPTRTSSMTTAIRSSHIDTQSELKTIMFVDDDDVVREVGANLLEKFGYNVLTAENGAVAVEKYAKDPSRIDLVILDIMMPVMDGVQAFTALKQINPNIKAVLVSGYSPNRAVREIQVNGCPPFMAKPFDIDVLAQKIEEILTA